MNLNTSFFYFFIFSGTLDPELGPKYLKELRPSNILGLSSTKLNFFENLVKCEWIEPTGVNQLWSTSNHLIIFCINLQIQNVIQFQ